MQITYLKVTKIIRILQTSSVQLVTYYHNNKFINIIIYFSTDEMVEVTDMGDH